MFDYFIPEHVPRRWIVGMWAAISAATLWGLVCLYGEAEIAEALGVAVAYVAVLTAGAMAYGTVSTFLFSSRWRAALVLLTPS